MANKPTLTTTGGAQVGDNQNSQTAGPRGPVMMQDYQLLEKLAHQNRERIAERSVHAKGWGAYGIVIGWGRTTKLYPSTRRNAQCIIITKTAR